MTALTATRVRTPKGATVRVLEGGSGSDVVFLHDVVGVLDDTSFLERLAGRHHVVAPELPGYGDSTGEELLEDMLDFALHGWDVLGAFGIDTPTLVGHGMGGMIAAEMATLCPEAIDRLVLAAPLGLWVNDIPLPDLFSLLPYEFPRLLFADPDAGERLLLPSGTSFGDLDALGDFYIGNTRRLGTASKILFPIPDRQLAKRLYRVTTPTLLVWGEGDAFVPLAYADRWSRLMPAADPLVETFAGVGHMTPYECPGAFADAVTGFAGPTLSSLRRSSSNG
jgi:pimeloyl-ACP methyl ester carboxylesterase